MAPLLFYTAIVGFITGIFIRSFYELPYDYLVVGLIGSLLTAGWWARQQSWRALLLSIFLLTGILGVLRFDMTTWDRPIVASSETVPSDETLTGVVSREPEQRERTTHVYLRPHQLETEILLYADRTTVVAYGDVISVRGEVERPEAFTTELGRTFNYPGYLEARGVSEVMFYPEVTVLRSDEGNPLLGALFAFKARFIQSIESVLPEPQGGLGQGLLLGVKSALGDELEEAFRRTGIIHIVVLSGYNVMLVVVFVMTILSYFLGLRARLPFGVAAIVAFAFLVGLSATVLRASIMAILILIARTTGNSYGVLRALFLAGLLMLLFNPYLLVFDPGFQLSFVATAGLILLAPHLDTLFSRIPNIVGVREFLVATIATQIFVLPLLLYLIGEFSVVSVLVNVLVLPMVPVAMFLTFVTGLVGLLSTSLALPLAYLTHLSLSYIITVATWFAAVPFAAFAVPPFPFPVMVLAYVALGYLLWRLWRPHEEHHRAQPETSTLSDWTIVEEHQTERTAPFFSNERKGIQ